MEKIESKNDSAKVFIEDAYVLTPRSRFLERNTAWIVVFVVAIAVAGGCAINHFYLEPREDAALVSKALQQLESSTYGKSAVQKLNRRNASDRVAMTYRMLMPSATDGGDRDRVEGYLAALRVAIRAGIPEAKLSYGVALRDGLTGKRDSAAALKIFDDVDREMASGVRAGDPVAMFVTAKMLNEGLGRQPDPQRAIELAKRAVTSLDGWRLESAGYDLALGFYDGLFKGYRGPEHVEKIASRLIEQKIESGPFIGSFSCVETEPTKRTQCNKGWYERGVNGGIDSAIPAYAGYLIETGEALQSVDKWFVRGSTFSSPYYRYQHAVVKAMLAVDDIALLSALSEMWKQIELGASENSLKRDYFGLDVFKTVLHKKTFTFEEAMGAASTEEDKFLIAANVRGILMKREEWMTQKLLELFADQPHLVKRLQNPEMMRKSKLAAQAILDKVPFAEVKLGALVKASKNSDASPVDLRQFTPVVPLQKKTTSSPSVAKDPEQRDRTGYLNGQPREAVGGLSTFTVDNRQGGRDAVARIYLNGRKPAVRSMYVKHGETFKAEAILSGTYVFRYRFIGSEDTFESDKDFPLTQTETETGTRYSNITVTLFKVKDGNMSTRKVDPNSF